MKFATSHVTKHEYYSEEKTVNSQSVASELSEVYGFAFQVVHLQVYNNKCILLEWITFVFSASSCFKLI